MKKQLEVKQSRIHGKGLFATKKIKKGSVLGKCKVKPRNKKKDTFYTLWVDDGERAFDVLCKLKYINHSKTPNVAYCDDFTVVALKTIKPGDELAHDYGDDWI